MLKIRLTRMGKTNDPRFRIVVAEHTKPVKGKFIAIVGHHDPIHKITVIKKDEIIDWLNKGATPSNRAAIILTKEGIKHSSIKIQKFNKKPKAKKGTNKDGETQKPTLAPANNETEPGKDEDKKDTSKENDVENKDSNKKEEIKIEDKKNAKADEAKK